MRTTPAVDTLERLALQGHLIDGSWSPSAAGGTYDHRYAATGEIQATLSLAGPHDVDRAVAAARTAQPAWAARSGEARGRILFRLADLLEAHAEEAAALGALDAGMPIKILNPAHYAARWVRYYAGWADKLDAGEPGGEADTRVVFEPLGVVVAIPPWNGSMMGMGQKVAPALAAGNAVVVKPPEIAPFGMLRFAELALEAGLPDGVLHVLVGGADTGRALAHHPGIDKISFTGGSETGKEIMRLAADSLTPVTLELGGKSPSIVFPDADLDAASQMSALVGTALLSGQGCALPTRTYVHTDIYEEFAARMVAIVESLTVGDPLDPATLVGPVVTEHSLERILGIIERARQDGATLLTGGRRLNGELAQGWFLAPTVFGHVDQDSELAQSEVFGPVHALLPFDDEERVLEQANDSPYGLNAYLHTRDDRRIARFSRELQTGTVVINGMGKNSPATPFGGTKSSGFGREGGRAGIVEMVRTKAVIERRLATP